MTQVGIADIRDKLADALNRVAYAGERIVVTRRGKSVAVLVSMEDFELLQAIEDPGDIQAARKALKEKGSVPLAAVKTRLGMK